MVERVGTAVRVRVMQQRMHRLIDQFRGFVAEQLGGRRVDERRSACLVQTVDTFPCLREDDFVQMAEAIENVFRPTALGNVTNDTAVEDGLVRVPHGQRKLERKPVPSLRNPSNSTRRPMRRVCPVSDPRQATLVGGAIPGRHQHAERLSTDLIVRVSEEMCGGAIPRKDMPLMIGQHNGVGCGFDQRLKSRLALVQGMLGMFDFGSQGVNSDRPLQDSAEFIPIVRVW